MKQVNLFLLFNELKTGEQNPSLLLNCFFISSLNSFKDYSKISTCCKFSEFLLFFFSDIYFNREFWVHKVLDIIGSFSVIKFFSTLWFKGRERTTKEVLQLRLSISSRFKRLNHGPHLNLLSPFDP